MSLKHSDFKPHYYKGKDDIAQEFYIPCLKNSREYLRITGYFRSSVFLIAWSGLREFIKNNGKIKIITSPKLNEKDVEALVQGSVSKKSEYLQKKLSLEIEDLINDSQLVQPTTILTSLYALGKIEFKIANYNMYQPVDSDYMRMMHDKTGIFKDIYENIVSFTGSMNETYLGLSNDGNYESVSVSVSWDEGRDKQRTKDNYNTFHDLWENKFDDMQVEEFSNVNIKKLKEHALPGDSWEDILIEVEKEINQKNNEKIITEKIVTRSLRPYQREAINLWKDNSYVGIFKHITGSGKTFTALNAIREMLNQKKIPIILVPSNGLQEQWKDEVIKELSDLNVIPILCGGIGDNKWKQNLRNITRKKTEINFLIISILNTARSDAFMSKLYDGNHLFLLVDEVHKLGSTENSKIMEKTFGPKLGLSATPEREGVFGGNNETERMFEFFSGSKKNGIVHEFSLEDALNYEPPVLSKYIYDIKFLYLNDEETDEYKKISSKISKMFAINGNLNTNDTSLTILLNKRADILKKAEAKIPLSSEIILENFKGDNSKWIVYCDDNEQLNQVEKEITEISKNINFQIFKFTSDEIPMKERQDTLKDFENMGGVILSCYMLDEGIDIPSVSSGLLLASSQSKREFIQRRGRVLRRDPKDFIDRKKVSYIFDTIVLPNSKKLNKYEENIVDIEFGRALEFAKFAENKIDCIGKINDKKIELGIDD